MRLRSVVYLASLSVVGLAGAWLSSTADEVSGPITNVGFAASDYGSEQEPTAKTDELKPKNTLLRIVGRDTFQLMNQYHLSKKKFDSGMASEGLKMYFRNLDPMKLYFYQSDIEEFSKRSDEVLKTWPEGKYELAFDIFNRYLKRVQEMVVIADEWIDSDFDFSVNEELTADAKLIQYCATEEEMKERWRQRIKYSLMLLEIEREENEKNMAEDPSKADASFENISSRDKLHRRYKALNRRMSQFIDEDVVELYLSAITTCFDPHTSYMSPTSYDDFMIQMRLNLEGIGATLQSTDDGLTTIKRVVPGGAADRSGEIQVDDKIVSVGQDTSGEMVDVTDMRLKDVVAMIRGKAGTNVRLNVLKKDGGGLKTISITREKIELTDSAARGKVFEQGLKLDGTPFKVGVIDLPSFYSDMEGARTQTDDFRSTTRDVQKLLDQFKQENVDSVVLDLRMNGGGSLREAIDCTGLFIDRGPIVQVKDPLGQIEQLDDTSGSVSWAGPLVVVTSKFSASASEILAGAIQDYNRGIVVGDPATHGKGTVQNLLNLAAQYDRSREAASSTTLGALKLTIQQFYRPGGDSTQLRGVVADVALPSITAQMDVAEGDLDYAMAFDQVPSARFTKLNMAGPDVVAKLTENSVKRRSESTDFQRLERDIKRYVDQKQRKTVTLNKSAYLAEREEFNAEKQDEDTVNKQVEGPSSEIQRDFYLDEILQIAADYSQMMKKS